MKRLVACVLALIVAGGVAAVVAHERGGTDCGGGEAAVAASAVPRAFDTDLAHPHDRHVATLVRAVDAMRLGRVVGAIGYDYDQWLTVGALPGSLATFTKGNAVVGVLGPDLTARWGLRQTKGQHAWDAAAGRLYWLRLPADEPMQVSAFALADGHRLWCAGVGTVPTRYDDPLGTAPLAGGGLLVLGDAAGPAGTFTRLAGNGDAVWTRTVSGIDRGDFVGDLGSGVAVVGGRAAYDLGNPDVPSPGGGSVVGVDEETGRVRWTHRPAGEVHVIGTEPDRVLLERFDAGRLTLVALDARGRVVWHSPAPSGAHNDVTLRDGVLVVRTDAALVGLDAADGHRRWRTPYSRAFRTGQRQLFPYGFVLDQQPQLDAAHLLVGTTDALRVLDLRTGRWTAYRLPTDGVSTTYWPYQLAVAGRLLVVATNTAAVVLRRP